ncbi:HYR domain-containing protein [Alkalibaculum sp. M08DMB]|uniref:HYR domain-containing protein n=1 Tax=Alkalibaculum sporogenes TaxID=2655001 RepID=A0A6A7KB53_9FIRM|nr:transglutaminase domain-containing protein [Alkalibaculum sporogenes]MPW26760.1 HYR domain-containing protein [Alkalibaculum sporogenes]
MLRVDRKNKRVLIVIVLAVIILIAILIIFSLNKLYKVVSIEAGTKTLETSQFIKNEKHIGEFKTDVSNVQSWEPGVYEIEIQIEKRVYSSNLEIIDTIHPVADIVNQEIWNDEEISASEFVENIIDETDVDVYYKQQPDFDKVGTQEVIIILEDTSQNLTELKGQLNVKEDIEPPTIKGASNKTIYIGDKVSYRNNITVTDNRDENVDLVVDSGNVNLKKVGSYEVTYTATDSSGNKTEETVTFKVKEKPKGYVDIADLNILSDKVLESIINDNMSQKEKAKAIYKWTKNQIKYVSYANSTDWVKAAYHGIKQRSGDCYVYYATAQELLTRAGIENQPIVKTGGGHYWNLINLGDGWYHFDATPRRAGGEFFMLTDAEIEKYSKKNKNSHVWDKSKYPATPQN